MWSITWIIRQIWYGFTPIKYNKEIILWAISQDCSDSYVRSHIFEWILFPSMVIDNNYFVNFEYLMQQFESSINISPAMCSLCWAQGAQHSRTLWYNLWNSHNSEAISRVNEGCINERFASANLFNTIY